MVALPDPLPSEPDALRAIIAAQAAELAARDAELRSERTLIEKLKAQLITPSPTTPEELKKRMNDEKALWADVIKAAGIRIE